MNIHLNEGLVADAPEAMDLSRLDDEDVTRAGFEFLSIDSPETATFPHELDFIVRVSMRPWSIARERAEEEHGDTDVAVVGSDEFVRAAVKGQVFLADTVHIPSLFAGTHHRMYGATLFAI